MQEEILTDQGSNFTSQLLAELYRLLHIQSIHTSPYYPQTDGLLEWFNQTLKNMLRKAVAKEGKDWEKWIPISCLHTRRFHKYQQGSPHLNCSMEGLCGGPLNILKESWEADRKSSENVISCIVHPREA